MREAFAQALTHQPAGRVPPWQLVFRQSRIGPNALALPGGTIIMTDELVNLVDGDTQVLSAVLALELGHVQQRHSLRLLVQATVLGTLSAVVLGDFNSVLASVPVMLGQAQYSREAEREADAHAVQVLKAAALSPAWSPCLTNSRPGARPDSPRASLPASPIVPGPGWGSPFRPTPRTLSGWRFFGRRRAKAAPALRYHGGHKAVFAAQADCPCGSGLPYGDCCGRWHVGWRDACYAPPRGADAFALQRLRAGVWWTTCWPPGTRPPRPGELELSPVKWLGLERCAMPQATGDAGRWWSLWRVAVTTDAACACTRSAGLCAKPTAGSTSTACRVTRHPINFLGCTFWG